jgi:hypothetical protein
MVAMTKLALDTSSTDWTLAGSVNAIRPPRSWRREERGKPWRASRKSSLSSAPDVRAHRSRGGMAGGIAFKSLRCSA